MIFQRGCLFYHQPVYQFMPYSAQMHCGQRDPHALVGPTVLADFTQRMKVNTAETSSEGIAIPDANHGTGI